jgi:peptide/nickel transport system permease protein
MRGRWAETQGAASGRNWRGLQRAGLGILLLFLGAVLLSSLIRTSGESARSLPFQPPSREHPLGTDDLGCDLLSLLVRSTPLSLLVGFGAGLVAVVIGTAVGLVSGSLRGGPGELFSGLIDVVLLIPMLPFMLLLVTTLGPGMESIILAIALIGWCPTARAVRARVLQLREAPFVEALTALGLTRSRILAHHVLPNVSEIVSAQFVLSVAGAMLSEAALSFMGLGDPVRPSWGKMMHYAFQRGGFANGLWNWYLPPGLCITACALGFVFLGLYWEKRSEIKTAPEWEA